MNSTKFFSKINISGNRTFRMREMTNLQFMALQKYIIADDVDDLNQYIDLLIQENQYDKDDVDCLNFIDKILILLNIRMFSVQTDIQTENNNISKSVSLEYIIEQIYNAQPTNIFTLNLDDTIIVEYGLPKTLIYRQEKDLLDECLISVCGIDLKSLVDVDRERIVSMIPQGYFNRIMQSIESILSELKDVEIDFALFENKVSFNYFSRELQLMCITLFKDDYIQFVELEYRYFSDMNGNFEHFSNISPLELQLFVQMHNKKIEKENEKQDEGRASMPQMPSMSSLKASMPSMPSFK